MPFSIVYDVNVTTIDIPALPVRNREQVKRAIVERLTVDPIGLGKPLQGKYKGYRRLRVGDWRILYRIEDSTVFIDAIGNRRDIYER